MGDAVHELPMSRPKNQTDGDGRLVESFRQERLEVLRKSISDGTYHVNDRSVAAAIVRRGISDIIARSKSRG
jgi:anti-sigma28 factor (negative regulator of flagellin synthesis)